MEAREKRAEAPSAVCSQIKKMTQYHPCVLILGGRNLHVTDSQEPVTAIFCVPLQPSGNSRKPVLEMLSQVS